MSNFGATTDHWGLAVTGEFIVVESSKIPVSNSRADATDENGDIADAAWYGNTDGELFDASVTYALIGGTGIPAGALKIGQIETGKVVTSTEISTSNDGWPQVTISGIIGSGALEQDKAYAIPDPAVLPRKQAQVCGAVAVTTGKLTSCSLTATCDWAQQDNGTGGPAAFGVGGGMLSATAEAVGISTEAPVLAAASGWTELNGTGIDEGQAAWHTCSITVEKVAAVTITT